MGELPVISGRELAKALGRLGYLADRHRASHMVLRHRDPPHRRLVVRDHREVARGTLRSILREAGLTVDELRTLLR